MTSKIYPELAQIETYMLEDPNYAFLMSYVFKNFIKLNTSDKIAGYNYSNEAWATPKFESALGYIYSSLNLPDPSKIGADGYKQIAKHLLANLTIQITMDMLAGKLMRGHYYIHPVSKATGQLSLTNAAAVSFGKAGTDFTLCFSNLLNGKVDERTIWIRLTDPEQGHFQQNWKTWPVKIMTGAGTTKLEFISLTQSLLDEILLGLL